MATDAQTFENSLATIGRNSLSAKAPGLFKHEIGFQVLDSDDDNTRAVGVFGFRVGDRLMYVPVFYRNGVIKGTEQLRDPKRKITVPLSDNYVNKILSDRGDEPPKRISRSNEKTTSQPSLWQLKYPPSKFASDSGKDWVNDVKLDLARVIGKPPTILGGQDDFDLLKEAADHPVLFSHLGELAKSYSWFGDAMMKYHGREKLAAAVEAAHSRSLVLAETRQKKASQAVLTLPDHKKEAAVRVMRVRMFTSLHVPDKMLDLDEGDRADIEKGRNVYDDKRKDSDKTEVKTFVGGNQSDGVSMSNPAHSGIYNVLMKDHDTAECAVLTHLVGKGEAVGRCVVVRLKDGAWAYTHPNAVWVHGEADQPAFKAWFDKLPEVKDPVQEGCWAAVIEAHSNPNGGWAGTVPFSVYEDGDAHFFCNPDYDRPFWAAFNPWRDRPDLHAGSRKDHAPERVEVFDESSRPVQSGNQLYLPSGSRLIDLTGPKFRPAGGADPERFLFGRKKKAGEQLIAVTKVAGDRIAVDDPRTGTACTFADGPDAEEHLILSHGLKVADARQIVDTALTKKAAAAFVKYAVPYTNLANNWPNAPAIAPDQIAVPAGFADDVVPTEAGASMAVPVQDLLMQASARERSRPYPVTHGVKIPMPGIGNGGEPPSSGPSGNDLKSISDAAGSGRRELFDTATLAALVKHTRLPSLLDRSLGHLSRAVSDLGDLLAHMYWNVDEWSEKFGQSEIGPLEDQIRGQFEGLGELALTLQEKAVSEGIDAGILPKIETGDGADTKN